MGNIVKLDSVSKEYYLGTKKRYALRNINLKIREGEFVTVVGKSGSGKTTLLNMLTKVDTQSDGTIEIAGRNIDSITESEANRWRGSNLGIVFQFFQLLPTLTVIENILLPMDMVNEIDKSERKKRAIELLVKVGLHSHSDKFPFELSGGEQQRCAIARALANNPSIIIADEPTGNLDSKTGDKIMKLLVSLKNEGKTIILVTHEKEEKLFSDRKVELLDGEIISDTGKGV